MTLHQRTRFSLLHRSGRNIRHPIARKLGVGLFIRAARQFTIQRDAVAVLAAAVAVELILNSVHVQMPPLIIAERAADSDFYFICIGVYFNPTPLGSG